MIFAVNDIFKPFLNKYGFTVISTGQKESYIEHYKDPRVWDPKFGTARIGWNSFLKPTFQASYRLVIDEHKRNRDIVLVGIQKHLNGGLTAAEKLSLPIIRFYLAPHDIDSEIKPPAPLKWSITKDLSNSQQQKLLKKIYEKQRKNYLRQTCIKEVNNIREQIGLKQISKSDLRNPFPENQLHIGLYPNWYARAASDWPKNINMVGFPSTDEIVTHCKPDVLKYLNGHSRRIVFTGGSAVHDTKKLFETGLNVCKKIGATGLFIGGDLSKGKIQEHGNLHVQYAPFEKVLPKCDAIVHHGGIGTLVQSIKANIPQIIRPLAYDQFDNGDRIHNLGLGSCILQNNFDEKSLKTSLETLLESEVVPRSLKYYDYLIRENDYISRIFRLINGFIKQPRDHFISPFERAVAEYVSNKSSISLNSTKWIKVSDKTQDGNAEAVAMGLVKYTEDIYLSLKSKSNSEGSLTLKGLTDVLKDSGVDFKVLSCDASSLLKLDLPVIIQWKYSRFITLIDFCKDKAIIRDPLMEISEVSLHEFSWNFSEVVICFP